MLLWYNNVMLDIPDSTFSESYSYIDVRDVALAHVVALEKRGSGGPAHHCVGRCYYLARNQCGSPLLIFTCGTLKLFPGNLVNELHPELLAAGVTLKGNPGLPQNIVFRYDSTKGRKILGLKYRDLAETIRDMMADFKKRGWLEAHGPSGGVPSA